LLARRPKTAKLVENARLRDYVQDRLSGQVRRPDGTPVSAYYLICRSPYDLTCRSAS
jgi:hypothetical protein